MKQKHPGLGISRIAKMAGCIVAFAKIRAIQHVSLRKYVWNIDGVWGLETPIGNIKGKQTISH